MLQVGVSYTLSNKATGGTREFRVRRIGKGERKGIRPGTVVIEIKGSDDNVRWEPIGELAGDDFVVFPKRQAAVKMVYGKLLTDGGFRAKQGIELI